MHGSWCDEVMDVKLVGISKVTLQIPASIWPQTDRGDELSFALKPYSTAAWAAELIYKFVTNF